MINNNYFIIKPRIYPFDVMVSVDEPDSVLLKRLIKYGNAKEDCETLLHMEKTTKGLCLMFDSGQTVIRLKRQSKKYEMVDTISHEVFHATVIIMHKMGMNLEPSVNEEAYAYLIGFLSAEIYKKLKV